ncbi:MAG TPA: hypothetical protein VNN17_08550, partial [Terriglobia bacterium]|nr:hypothetical protein [Terriglobia bacterium]
PVEDSGSPSFRQLTAWASLAIFLQLALGAALRHEALNILPHLVGAAGVCGMVGWVVLRAMRSLPEQKPLQRLAVLLGVLLIVQLALGGVSYFARLAHTARPGPGIDETMIWTTSAHVAVGALVLGTSWVLTLHSWRRLSPCRAASPFHSSPQKSPA